MGMTKYQKTEAVEVVSPEGHEAISDELNKLGKTSARNLSKAERKQVLDEITQESQDSPGGYR